ncbi:MAG: hypothetical protein KAU90_12620 [Sulfurovaceae bacterium]|nr:hypothetical protein [Sulfurovaceae bacterium]
MILKIISLIFIFQKMLLANNIPIDNQNINSVVYTKSTQSNIEVTNSSEKKVVFLESVEGIGIVILIILTSLIGAFFLRNEDL